MQNTNDKEKDTEDQLYKMLLDARAMSAMNKEGNETCLHLIRSDPGPKHIVSRDCWCEPYLIHENAHQEIWAHRRMN